MASAKHAMDFCVHFDLDNEVEADDPDLDEELETAKQDQDDVLHLNYKGLHNLPRKLILEAKEFMNVTRIFLKRNKLKTLPEEIGKLANLVELYIPENELTHLPEGLGRLSKLESLDVSCNDLSSLPASICRLSALERLHLAHNRFSHIPKEVNNLQHLVTLDLMYNRIQHIAKDIKNCTNLTRLLLDRNNLQWLPRQLCQLSHLEELSVAGNQLLCLPLDMGQMKSLKCVYVDNNPFLHAVPISISSQELGFNSCGLYNYNDPDSDVQCLDVQQSESVMKKIYLPREILAQGDGSRMKSTVPPLLELAMRKVHGQYKDDLTVISDYLTPDMYDLLCSPVCCCPCCETPIFTVGYPMVFEGQLRVYRIYRLALCCTPACVRIATLLINLPLIHPDPSGMCMALALVE